MKCCKRCICLSLLMLGHELLYVYFYLTSYIGHLFHVLQLFPLKWIEKEITQEAMVRGLKVYARIDIHHFVPHDGVWLEDGHLVNTTKHNHQC